MFEIYFFKAIPPEIALLPLCCGGAILVPALYLTTIIFLSARPVASTHVLLTRVQVVLTPPQVEPIQAQPRRSFYVYR